MGQEKLKISGGRALQGEIWIDGAKNAALKLLAASLLTREPLELKQVPHLHDVSVMLNLLAGLGAQITLKDRNTVILDCSQITQITVSYELVKAMRASIVVLGPLLARMGEARVALPGGCAIGSRPIDIHVEGLRAMGAEIDIQDGFVHARAKRLKGAHIVCHTVSVTGTENLMMAATLADGVTVIENAAREPEVVDLGDCLNRMGAKISGLGSSRIEIEGVSELHGAVHTTLPDRIEAGTYLVAAAMTQGLVTTRFIHPRPNPLTPEGLGLDKVREAGALVIESPDAVTVDMRGRQLKAIDIETAPFPGFATDLQAQFMALNAVAEGEGNIRETVFENRFMHVAELKRLGAQIEVQGNLATTRKSPDKLVGCQVTATDLRASACLVLGGLVAQGETVLDGIHHMDRGYVNLEEKFSKLGAKISRVLV